MDLEVCIYFRGVNDAYVRGDTSRARAHAEFLGLKVHLGYVLGEKVMTALTLMPPLTPPLLTLPLLPGLDPTACTDAEFVDPQPTLTDV